MVPLWLQELLGCNHFFNICLNHQEVKPNIVNTFCKDCAEIIDKQTPTLLTTLCPHCLLSHSNHHSLLKIKRYVNRNVLGLKEAVKHFDCSSIQPYFTNGDKVVFLHPRELPRQGRVSGNLCITCDRSLRPPFRFCSISCKHRLQFHHIDKPQAIATLERDFVANVVRRRRTHRVRVS